MEWVNAWGSRLVAAGLVLVSVSPALRKWRNADSFIYHTIREFGIAALVAGAGVLIVDANMAKLHQRNVQEIESMFANQRLPDMLEGAVGESGSEAIRSQILNPEFVYRKYGVMLDLESRRDSLGEFLSGTATSTIRVTNRSMAKARFLVQQQLTDLKPGRMASFDSATLYEVTSGGQRIGQALVALNSSDLHALERPLGPTGKMFSKAVELQAGRTYDVLYRNSVSLDATDEYVLRTRFLCEQMEVVLVMPTEFSVEASANHPQAADSVVFPHGRDGRFCKASLTRACLPYQGIRLSWAPADRSRR